MRNKKEPLSLIVVKTILTTAVFVGVGMIIVGGGWLLVGNYGKIYEPIKKNAVIDNDEMKDEITNWKTYANPQASFTFEYPDDWEIVEDYFYETAAGIKAKNPTIVLQKIGNEDSNDWTRINPRQFNCEHGKCVEANYITIGTYSKNSEILSVFSKIAESFKKIEINETVDSKSENFITDYRIDSKTKVRVEMTSPKTMEKNKENEVKIIISGWDKVGLNLYQSFLSVKNITKYRLSTEENVSCKQNYGKKECSIFVTPLCEWPDSITLYPLIYRLDFPSMGFNIILKNPDSEICDNGIDDDCNGQIDGVDLKCAVFTISVLPGEGLTNLARRAVVQYLKKFYDDSYLDKEQKIYAEDYIKRNLKNEIGVLKSGEKIEFSSSLIEEAIAKSKRLSSDEINSIGKYKELINYSGYKIISKSESVADVDAMWRIDDNTKEQLEKVKRFKDDASKAWKVVNSEGSVVIYYQNENIDKVFYLIGAYRENMVAQDYSIMEDLLIHSVELSDDGVNWGKGKVVYNNFYDKNSSSSGGDGKGIGSFYVDVKDYNKSSLYIRFNLKSFTSGTGITLTKNLKANLSDADLSEKEKATIIYPDKSSVLETGETYQIQWKPNDPDRLVGIMLNNNTTIYSEDALVWHLRESVPDTGNYSFTVPKNLKTGSKYQLIITQYYHHKIGINTLVSDEFSIMSE